MRLDIVGYSACKTNMVEDNNIIIYLAANGLSPGGSGSGRLGMKYTSQ